MKNFKQTAVRTLAKIGLKLKDHSPTIFTVGGIVLIVSGGVIACHQTLKAHEVIEAHKERLAEIHEAKEISDSQYEIEGEVYDERDYRRDLVVSYSKTALDFLKLYGLPILLTAGGVIAILAGHNILKKRNLALTAAYTAVDTAFKEYRARVRNELGDDADYRFRTGAERVKLKEVTVDEDGNETVTKVDGLNVNSSDYIPSMYAKFFDESNVFWEKDANLNLYFLKSRQAELNNILLYRGYVTLNEVYEKIGFPPTSYGAVVGWMSDRSKGDGFIDFGIFNAKNEGARRFVNGEEKSILLDFNVDGIINDRFDSNHVPVTVYQKHK